MTVRQAYRYLREQGASTHQSWNEEGTTVKAATGHVSWARGRGLEAIRLAVRRLKYKIEKERRDALGRKE